MHDLTCLRPATGTVRLLASFVALILLVAAPALAEPKQAPGSRVVIDLPDDFTPADRFLGFAHPSGASIVILEVPGHAFTQMRAAFTADALAGRGIIDVKTLDLGGTNRNRMAATGRQGTPAGWFEKIMLLIGDPDTTAIVTVNIPETAASDGQIEIAAMVEAIRGARLAPKAPPGDLPYTISDPSPLRFVTTLAGAGQLYNETGKLPTAPVENLGTTFVVASSMDRRAIDDRDAFVMRLLQSLDGLKNVTLSRTEAVEIDGLKGTAQHVRALSVRRSGAEEPALIYHAVLFDPDGGYYRMVGRAPVARGQAAMADFVRMAKSFTRRQKSRN